MIRVQISVEVDGVTYSLNRDEQSNPGRNSTLKAVGFFESQVAVIKKAMQSHIEDDRPVPESRNVDSGPIQITMPLGETGVYPDGANY